MIDTDLVNTLLQRIEALEIKVQELNQREQPLGGGGTGVTNQVAVFNTTKTIVGDNDLVFDLVNKRLGIRTNAPSYPLHLATAGGWAFAIVNGAISYRMSENALGAYNGAAASSLLLNPDGNSVLMGKASGLTGNGDVDANGRVRGATFETASGSKWALQGYTGGTFGQTGYVTVVIDGVARRLMVG